MMKTKILKATLVVAKILEITCLVVMLSYFVAFIFSLFAPNSVSGVMKSLAEKNNSELSVQGFDIIVLKEGEIVKSAIVAFCLAGIFSFACRTMIFRNIYLILKTSAGKTKFATGETPFQKDTIRMVREIGIFYILIPVIQTIINIIFRFVENEMETSVRIEGIIAGLVILALSEIFNYGEKLESDVQGLI